VARLHERPTRMTLGGEVAWCCLSESGRPPDNGLAWRGVGGICGNTRGRQQAWPRTGRSTMTSNGVRGRARAGRGDCLGGGLLRQWLFGHGWHGAEVVRRAVQLRASSVAVKIGESFPDMWGHTREIGG
jgi:hypothetical protein